MISNLQILWFGMSNYFAQRVEDLVEVKQDFSFGDFGNVVHALACVVPNAGILVTEAGKDRRNDFLEVSSYFLS